MPNNDTPTPADAPTSTRPPSHRLICGDCVDVLPTLPRDSIDAIITDPPYFLPARQYYTADGGARWSDVSSLTHQMRALIKAWEGALKPTGQVLVFAGPEAYAAWLPALFDAFGLVRTVVWRKPHPGRGATFHHQHELALYARWSRSWSPRAFQFSDVIDAPIVPPKIRRHPVHKPPELLRQLVEATCPPGGVVCDPFMGSGSTGEGALIAGRSFVGIEMDQRHFETTRRALGRWRDGLVLEEGAGEVGVQVELLG